MNTPGPWFQGITLMTAQTKRWSAAELAENDRKEKRMIFANFSAIQTMRDQGRGRVRVAIFENEEDAQLAAQAPAMLARLQAIAKAIDDSDNWRLPQYLDLEDIERLITAATKVRGGPS
jgi:hypothetical protein